MTTTELPRTGDAHQPPKTDATPKRCEWLKGDFDADTPKMRCRLDDGHAGEHSYE